MKLTGLISCDAEKYGQLGFIKNQIRRVDERVVIRRIEPPTQDTISSIYGWGHNISFTKSLQLKSFQDGKIFFFEGQSDFSLDDIKKWKNDLRRRCQWELYPDSTIKETYFSRIHTFDCSNSACDFRDQIQFKNVEFSENSRHSFRPKVSPLAYFADLLLSNSDTFPVCAEVAEQITGGMAKKSPIAEILRECRWVDLPSWLCAVMRADDWGERAAKAFLKAALRSAKQVDDFQAMALASMICSNPTRTS